MSPSVYLLVSLSLSACGTAAAPHVAAPPTVTSDAAAPPPAEPAATDSAQPGAAPPLEAECRSTCAAELASSREEIATQLGQRFEACPSEADNDRADCLEGANAQLATANEQVDAAFAACNAACAPLGE